MLEFIGGAFVTIVALYAILGIIYTAFAATIFCGFKNSWIGIVIGTVMIVGILVGWWFLVGTHIRVSFG